MKSKLMALTLGTVTIAFLSLIGSDVSAQNPPATSSNPAVELPLGLRCVVTLDPAAPDRTIPVEPLRASGFYAPNTTEGTLVRLDADWVVLRDGNYDNWIPRNKVLLLRSSRR